MHGLIIDRKLSGMSFRPPRKIKKRPRPTGTQGNLSKENTFESGCWKKKSIFFQLEYWKHLLVHHNLDVTHIEKNVCDSIIGTILNMPGKPKTG